MKIVSDDIVTVDKIICYGNMKSFESAEAHRVKTLRGNRYVIVNKHMPEMLNSIGFIWEKEGQRIFVEDSLTSILSFLGKAGGISPP